MVNKHEHFFCINKIEIFIIMGTLHKVVVDRIGQGVKSPSQHHTLFKGNFDKCYKSKSILIAFSILYAMIALNLHSHCDIP